MTLTNKDDLKTQFTQLGADYEFTLKILEKLNQGQINSPATKVKDFPLPDGQRIWDWRTPTGAWLPASAKIAFTEYFPHLKWENYFTLDEPHQNKRSGFFWINLCELEDLGLRLSRKTAYGILNGGMATSYADSKKNLALNKDLFELYQADFQRLVPSIVSKPKGITPAFIQAEGTAGPDFLELKLRHLLLLNQKTQAKNYEGPGLVMFQMTSSATHKSIQEALENYKTSPLLKDLLKYYPLDLQDSPTRVQTLLGTFTQVKEGENRKLFTVKTKLGDRPYCLPGGHGQNFLVLADLYKDLVDQGYEFAYLGNVDNLGNLISPSSLALFALSESPAAFDFSFKTSLDVKGGVLYEDPTGKLNCADIGVSIPSEQVQAAEKADKPILFNCATGIFKLKDLIAQLDYIIENLPIRLSNQDKDIGKYTQVEQVTWEVIGLLENPMILGVEKSSRFLAAKLFLDCLLTSARHLDSKFFSTSEGQSWKSLALTLNQGLEKLLAGPYGLHKTDKGWQP